MRDLKRDDFNLKKIPLKQIRKDMQNKAYVNALKEHRVSHFVKNLPFDDTSSYPAIMYLTVANEKFANDKVLSNDTSGRNAGNRESVSGKEPNVSDDLSVNIAIPSREAEETLTPQERYLTKGRRRYRKLSERQVKDYLERVSKKKASGPTSDRISDDGSDHPFKDTSNHRIPNDGSDDHTHDNCTSAQEYDTSWYYTSDEAIEEISRATEQYHQLVSEPNFRIPTDYISWGIPAHDHKRQKERGCGFYHADDGTTVYSACPTDHDHHIKAKAKHCWSLACPKCMNDTALRDGIEVEKRMLTFEYLTRKKGDNPGPLAHFVISPPQTFTKSMCQTGEEFNLLYRFINDKLMSIGAKAGTTIFHPWRQWEDKWRFSPHFHALLYGRLDTAQFIRDLPGWVIKKVHPKEKMRSIRHTYAYLSTHRGLGRVAVDPDEVDWDLMVMNYLIPGIKSEGADFRDQDFEKEIEDKGKRVGDISDADWIGLTIKALSKEIRMRWWGGLSKGKLASVAVQREYKVRVCKECGALLRTYDGFHDTTGEIVRYIKDSQIIAFRQDVQLVRSQFLLFKAKLRDDSDVTQQWVDFSKESDLVISTSDIGMDSDSVDITLDGPFDHPDEYYLNRQRIAFGGTASLGIAVPIIETATGDGDSAP